MTKGGGYRTSKTAAELREERLKAALKANMARRKAQARARKGQQAPEKDDDRTSEESR